MVGDKLYFSWTRWMSYGLCFLEGWMWNHCWGAYEENQILKMLLKGSWRNVKTKMDVKEEVMSVRCQVRWRISQINSEFCRGKFWVRHIFKRHDGNEYRKQLITFNATRRTSLKSSREGNYWLSMEQTYFKSRRRIVILL